MTTKLRPRFWERIPLKKMTPAEWEAVCDGCGKCCLLKLQDAETDEISYTNVACRLLDRMREDLRAQIAATKAR